MPQTSNDPQHDEEQERDLILRRLLKMPPQPCPKRERGLPSSLSFLVIGGKFRVAENLHHNHDGSIAADVYRNLEDYRVGRVMERAATLVC